MKQLKEYTICKSCLGCNMLELEEFDGKYYCKNYIRGDKDELQDNNKCNTAEQ